MAPPSLIISAIPGRGGCLLRLDGVIDESFAPAKLIDAARGVVVFDLDKVRRITSFGVREWVNAMRFVAADYACFVRVRPMLVAQFNMVADFAGRGQLVSFYAPYACTACGKEIDVLIDLRKQLDQVKAYSPPEVACNGCGSPAQLDDLADSYFSYAAAAPAPTPPPTIDALLAGSAPVGVPFRVEKEVEGDVTALWFTGDLDKAANFRRLADGLEGQVVLLTEAIEHATDEGIARLRGFLEATSAEVTLARVPYRLLAPIGRAPDAVARAKVVSVRLPFDCLTCKRRDQFDIEGKEITVLARGGPPSAVCRQCGGPLLLELPEPERAGLRALVAGEAPRTVAAYLDHQKVQPSKAGTPEGRTANGQPFGRYMLLRPIGAGGMAEVFLARQSSVGGFEKQVVVKRILPNLSSDTSFIEMFLHEARVAARISHPNVVQIFDVGAANGQYYIAMEYVRGWDLNAVVRLCTRLDMPFPIELGCRVIADVCAGLHAAHTLGDEGSGSRAQVVHRDVSPHNVLISSSGQVKLTDFGIAKAVDSGQHTPTATLKGKLTFMSPEQVKSDGGAIDARSDIFPAAVMLYQLLTLEHLFRRDSEFSTLKAILHDPVPRLSHRRPDAPPALEAALDRALAREPEARFATAQAFQQALEAVIAATGKRATSVELADWLKQLFKRGEAMGQLPPEMAFTPTGDVRIGERPPNGSRTATEQTSPTVRKKG